FVAGALYAFSSNKMLYASLGQFNIASSQWIPFYVLILLKITRNANGEWRMAIRYGFLLGLFLLFQSLSEFIFASFLIIFTILYLIYRLLATRLKLITDYRLLITFLVAALTFVIPMLPILAAMIQDMLTEGDFIQRGLGFADVFSNDVLGFFVPSHLHPIFGALETQFHFAYTNFAYLGFAALLLAVIALWKVPQARIWGIFGAIFVLLTLGPDLNVNGTAISAPYLPFNLLLDLPFIKGNRYPSRWSVMVTLALAVMGGYGVAWASQKLHLPLRAVQGKVKSQKWPLLFAASLSLLILFEHLSIPLPTSNFQIPAVYQTIAQDQGDFTVLEIPLAWRNGFRMTGTLDAEMMFEQWYQTAQRHPILGGNTSRNPELKFQYFTEAPVINSLIALETGHTLDDATRQRDRELAPAVLRFFGVRYVVWHSPRDPQNRRALDAARAYAQSVLPVTKISEVSDDTGETVVFRVNDAPAASGSTMIRADDPMARLNFAEGWGALGGASIWATRRDAKMFVRVDEPQDATMTIRFFTPTA
ncbi:MAG TPA: A24 family peptidase, partial [Anaerolineae bacterium]